jgi:hypothetical protein
LGEQQEAAVQLWLNGGGGIAAAINYPSGVAIRENQQITALIKFIDGCRKRK